MLEDVTEPDVTTDGLMTPLTLLRGRRMSAAETGPALADVRVGLEAE